MRIREILALLWIALFAVTNVYAANSIDQIRPFLNKHCIECHGKEKQENDLRFDTLGADLSDRTTLETWQNILDQVNLGEMPPQEPAQLETVESNPFVDSLSMILKQAYTARRSNDAKTVIRRLNRYELRNTLRDLLHLEGAAYQPGAVANLVDNNGNGRVERKGTDPVRAFPKDEQENGFVNLGDRLVMSDFLLKLTLEAAQETLDSATHTEVKPTVATRHFAGHLVTKKSNGQQPLEGVSRELNPDFDLLTQRYQRYGRLSPTELQKGVGTSARYRITIEASGHNQKHPWGDMIANDPNSPFLLGLHIADTTNGGVSGPTSTPLVQWELPSDGSRKTFRFETWIDDTWTPWLGWENGPYDRQFKAERLVEKYLPHLYQPRPNKNDVDQANYDAWPREMAATLLKSGYQGPHVRIYSLTLEPLIDVWPPQSHTALYGAESAEKLSSSAEIEKLLVAFAQRAYRRPVTSTDIQPYATLVRQIIDSSSNLKSGAIQNLTYKSYPGSWTKLPQFSALSPSKQGVLSGGLIDLRASQREEMYGIVFEGKLEVEQSGEYQFQIASDDGSRLLIDKNVIVEHDGLHGASKKVGKTQLLKGTHAIRVEYFAYGKPNSLDVRWSGPGFFNERLTVDPKSPSQISAVNDQTAHVIKALQAGYTAILCSPRFLYLQEAGGRLDDFELASRLSYFLWASMPDERLMQLAKNGKLTDSGILRSEVERMLQDKKAEAFTRNFPIAWLRLDKLGKMPPEKKGPFRFYHDRNMEPQLVAQTAAYFAEIVKSNGKIQEFIDSNATFMNEELAVWFYGRSDVYGSHLRKVALNDPRRGGIFTQPSVMTATANGVDTTPVVRGVYVLENILGTPPSPPPPDVEPLAPDLRKATTIRQQLELHRKHQSCNTCHRKIDPLGFAMENFDPVGRWRDRYPNAKQAIDASSTMADGQQVEDIVAFKKILLTRKKEVTRCLTEKLLTYAMGRVLEPIDRGEVDRIVAELDAQGNGLRDLIQLVVQSELFLTK